MFKLNGLNSSDSSNSVPRKGRMAKGVRTLVYSVALSILAAC
jgi:predicted RNA-binding protein YlqC (UPF0109 family)